MLAMRTNLAIASRNETNRNIYLCLPYVVPLFCAYDNIISLIKLYSVQKRPIKLSNKSHIHKPL